MYVWYTEQEKLRNLIKVAVIRQYRVSKVGDLWFIEISQNWGISKAQASQILEIIKITLKKTETFLKKFLTWPPLSVKFFKIPQADLRYL